MGCPHIIRPTPERFRSVEKKNAIGLRESLLVHLLLVLVLGLAIALRSLG